MSLSKSVKGLDQKDADDLSKRNVAVLGAQWGDEGKGKLVDILARVYDLICRHNGGGNAGHKVKVDGTTHAFHLLTSAMLHKNKTSLLGHGVVINLEGLFKEIDDMREKGASAVTPAEFKIAERAHIVFDFHKIADKLYEEELAAKCLGTTRQGIGPCSSDKVRRKGLRVVDMFSETFDERVGALLGELRKRFPASRELADYDLEALLERLRGLRARIRPHMVDGALFLNEKLDAGKSALFEGANATMLDLDVGSYPFVTSSCTTVGGVCQGLGISPKRIGKVVGVVKAFSTRVGAGPFATELLDEVGDFLRTKGGEFGTTTGRPRRIGWLDLVVVRYTHMINGYDSLNLTKLDTLTGQPVLRVAVAYEHKGLTLKSIPANLNTYSEVKVVYEQFVGWQEDISQCREFEQLPLRCREYVSFIQGFLGVPIEWIGVGAGREDMIHVPLP